MITFDAACLFPDGSCHLAVIPLAACSTSTQTATIEDLSLAADVQPLEKARLIAGCFRMVVEKHNTGGLETG